jgi:hypothetical protein
MERTDLNERIARAKGWTNDKGFWLPPKDARHNEGHTPFYTTNPAEWGPLLVDILTWASTTGRIEIEVDVDPYYHIRNYGTTLGSQPDFGHAVCEAWLAVKGEGGGGVGNDS